MTRWQNGLLPYFAVADAGGVAPEGSQYGRYMYEYPMVPFTTASLMGRDLFSETNWYKEAVFAMIYATSPAPIASAYLVFPFNDDEKSWGSPAASEWYYGDLMTMLANEWSGLPVGQYARQWINTVQPDRSSICRGDGPGWDGASLQ